MVPEIKKSYTEKKNEKSRIGIWLDSYDEIFSDFDPRIYSQRTISEDFLSRAKNIAADFKTGDMELVFLLPKKARDNNLEQIIKRRLLQFFENESEYLTKLKKNIIKKGLITTIIGMVLMFCASLLYDYTDKGYIYNLMLVFIEPTGWFMAWYGLDTIFYSAKDATVNLSFLSKMRGAEINFDTYS